MSSVALLLSGLMTLSWGGAFFYQQLTQILRHYLGHAAGIRVNADNLRHIALMALEQFALVMAPLFLVLAAVAVLANFLQVGPVWSGKALQPNFGKINPAEGIKRLFSPQSLAELAKSLLKITIVGAIAYFTVAGELDRLLPLLDQTPYQILAFLGDVCGRLFWRVCLVLAALAVLDFLFQKWQWERDHRMTKQEVKEEYKQTEGDPKVKARIRSIQRDMARKRMMAAVPEADVVITNPTHLAVALQYESGKMEAPVVTAKGAGLIAERIREIAREHDVPIVEDRPLARNLYKSVEVGRPIPEALYQAVAEVLAYVYRLRRMKAAGGGR